MIKQKADENNVNLDPENRYVIVDAFLAFIAKRHEDAISLFKQQIQNGGLGFD
jgi:hypothetical protein